MPLTMERNVSNMTLNYAVVFTACYQIAVHKGLYATIFSSMDRQAEQEVSRKLSDLNNV